MEQTLRVHTALTADAERRFLIWMARQLPDWVDPDLLTGLGFAAQVLAGAAYAISGAHPAVLWLVSGLLTVNWFGDSLDGTVARVRNRQRPRYGFYVDHMADTFGAMALTAGMGASGWMHWPVAAGLLAGFYVLAIESFLATHTLGRFHVSHGMFGPTEIRIGLIFANTLLFLHPVKFGFDIGGCVAIAGMAAIVATVAPRHTRQLHREETQ